MVLLKLPARGFHVRAIQCLVAGAPPILNRGVPMQLLLILLLVLLIAQIGFWDTLGALLGAAAMIALFILLAAGAVAIAGYVLYRRVRRWR